MLEIFFWGSFLLLFYTYFGYPIIILLIGKFKTVRSYPQVGKPWPLISVVVAAHNEEAMIRSKIENLLGLNYPPDRLEIIVVSDASTDRTDSMVSAFSHLGVRLMRCHPRAGKTAALNFACPRASGDILVFSDANGILQENALRVLVRHFNDPRVGCVCGAVHYVSSSNTAAHQGESLYMRYDSWVKKLENRLGSVMGAFGGIFAFRREFFAPMDSMLPVDMEIPLQVLRKHYRVLFEGAAICTEPASGRIAVEFGRHARINARLFYGMTRWLRALLNPFCPFILFQFVSKKVLRWLSPLYFLILLALPFFIQRSSFRMFLIANLIFLGAAGVGALLSWAGKSKPLFSFTLHFLIGNLAVAWGFVRFLTRRQGPTWAVARER
jgi:cellulose synthase/poly-beta-1,6-N-acetylglucosamine synthase-like glycosyltransferase